MSQTATYEQVKNGFTKFIDGDVIMAKITPCMENGKIAIAKNLKNGTGFGSTEFHVFRPKSCGVLNAYLFFYFLQDSFRQKARMNMTGTAGQLRVPAKFMKDVMLPLPPTNEQKRITATITNLFQIANNVEENMKKAHRHTLLMKRVILSKAFRGELVPQDPNYEPASVLLQRIKNSANKT